MSIETKRGLPALVFDTLNAAPEPKTFQELIDLFGPTVQTAGFTYFAVVEASPIPKNRSLTVLYGRSDTAWSDVYVREGLAGVDPRMRHMLRSVEPAFLSELIPCCHADDDQQFLSRFRSYGHVDCFVWPVHLPEGRVRAVLMLTDLHELHTDAKIAASALAGGFHVAGVKLLRRLRAANGHEVELRPRQLECLYWARQGKSSAVIGFILGLSARTVDEHIAHACEALGVRTRIQAVARAVILGLF